MKNATTKQSKNILNKPKIVIPVVFVIALIIGIIIYLSIGTSKNYETTPVVLGTVSSSLSSTGVVKAATETDLAFPKGGRVSAVNVNVGDTVYQGQTLASLDSTNEEGVVEQATGAEQAAEASYTKLINGASSADVTVAQVNYDTTVAQQKILVSAAYSKLLSTDLIPTAPSAVNSATPVISGTYNGTTEGTLSIQVHASGSNSYFTTSGLSTAIGTVSAQGPQPIGTTGLSILFPSGDQSDATTWTITIPNTSGPNYTADENAYQTALQTQTDAIAQAQAALDKVNVAPRPEDVAVAEAQVASAKGALQTAQGSLADDFITAPINGVISAVNDLTVGEIVNANTPVISIISQSGYQIESYVSEKDLALVTVGEPVSIVTDAYGPSVIFKGTVIEVAPAATTQANGTLGYKVTYQFSGTDSRVKPGLSATVELSGSEKDNVLTVPKSAVFLQNGATFVIVKNGKNTEDRAVTIGLVGTDTDEVVSGLTAGEQVVTLGAVNQ